MQDLVYIGLLNLRFKTKLFDEQLLRFLEHRGYFRMHILIFKSIRNLVDSRLVAKVGSRSVAGVDGKQLASDVRCEIINPRDTWDVWNIVTEWCRFNSPLVVGLHGDIQALTWRLVGHNAVHRSVSKHCNLIHFWEFCTHCFRQTIGCVDGVFTRHDCYLCGVSGFHTSLQALGDRRSNNPQDCWTHRSGDHISVQNMCLQTIKIGARIHTGETRYLNVSRLLPYFVDSVGFF